MKYDAEVKRAVAHWGPSFGVAIDPALVHAVIAQESSHGAALQAAEPGGRFSYGPMMVLDSTARALGVNDPHLLRDPALGIWYGVRVLAEELRRFSGDVARALSAYNTGPVRAQRNAQGKFPNQPYVDKVLGFWQRFRSVAVAAAPAAGVAALAVLVLVLATRRRRLAA